MTIAEQYNSNSSVIIYNGDTLDFLKTIPDETVKLIVTSPPYNIGKSYEKKTKLENYITDQEKVITECTRILRTDGSICWQIGNYVNNGSIIPLDIALYPIFNKLGLKMRNRIIWNFEHGLHCTNRLSGRYETICWYTKGDNYTFNLDPIRIPQKYPGKKYYKGPKVGQYSSNPLGKNPGDIWSIPNVKNNHVEKTSHPCQFPVELIERLVLALTNEGEIVLDPYLGSGTSIISAILHNRKGFGAEIMKDYVEIARDRISKAIKGELKIRKMNTPIYDPESNNSSLTKNPWKEKT